MDKLFVTSFGISMILAIYWFFFGKPSSTGEAKSNWTITVQGGYNPKTITIPSQKPSTITFIRTDPNSCLEEVVIPDFHVKHFLPMNTPVSINIPPQAHGSYPIHCGMNMFHARVIVS